MMTVVTNHLGGFPLAQLDWQQLSPFSSQEAVLYFRIEGTQATLAEVLEFESDAEASTLPQERRDDIRDVQNYRHAMRQAVELLATLPLLLWVINNLHATLLSGARGDDKAPGELHKLPNWMGPRGCTIADARFVPIKRILHFPENTEILGLIREASGRRPRVLCKEQLLAVAEGRP
jgi:hypothetical protein